MARHLLDRERSSRARRVSSTRRCVGHRGEQGEGLSVTPLTLSAATALNPHIGYDRASEIVKEAASSGRPLRDVAREAGVDEAVLDQALDYRAMAKPHGD